VIPSTVVNISCKAFEDFRVLKEVVLVEGVRSIGDDAFWGCRSLESTNIPSTLVEIGWNAFDHSSPLNEKLNGIYSKAMCDTSSITTQPITTSPAHTDQF